MLYALLAGLSTGWRLFTIIDRTVDPKGKIPFRIPFIG